MSPAKYFTASACNNLSDSITEIVILEQFDYYNQKQNKVLYVNIENLDFLPQTAAGLVFALETCKPYMPKRDDYSIVCCIGFVDKLSKPTMHLVLDLLLHTANISFKCD